MGMGSRRWKRAVAAATVTAMAGLGSAGVGSAALPSAVRAAPATASPTGVDRTPVMGWSSWSFMRLGVDTKRIEGEAKALVSTGLSKYGYKYVNIDDNWYRCPGPQGPDVNSHGLWVVNGAEFPNAGSENGIAAVAAYVHHLGLKFGIYETAGISDQAVAKNTPVAGTNYTAKEIATKTPQPNYNCGGMVDLNYRSPGAQPYVDSVVDQLARWGIDYIKLDGITNHNAADVRAWSKAIKQSGRPMVLNITQGSYTIKLAPTLRSYANQWEFTPDIEINGPDEGSAAACNQAPFTGCKSVWPLTSYSHWSDRFAALAQWQPYGGPGGFNDYDSIEVGNGPAKSGMSPAAQRSQLSLWALGSAPLILGGDLSRSVSNAYGSSSGLTSADLSLLENRSVLDVDRDAIDASRIFASGDAQLFSKREVAGDAIVGLFDTDQAAGAKAETISTTATATGLPADKAGYRVKDLWTGKTRTVSSIGTITAVVAPEGVALLKITPIG